MVLDSKNFLINVLIKENMPMVNLKELVVIHGLMDNFIKDNGYVEWNKAQECGEEPKVILILDYGKWEKQMVMVFIHGLTVIDIKVSFVNV